MGVVTAVEEELAQLLGRAGLETLGQADHRLPPPRALWRLIHRSEAVESSVVHRDGPGLDEELNERWHRLALRHGVIDENGDFVLHVSGKLACGCLSETWSRVRLTAEWNPARLLDREHQGPGRDIEGWGFVALSTDGEALLAVTSAQRLVCCDAFHGVTTSYETAVHEEARETPEERAAAWAAMEVTPSAAERSWAHGLVLNEATPDDLRLRLLGRTQGLLRRQLSPTVIDAAIAHPEWKVRFQLADAQPRLTVEQWSRLILAEPEPRRRWLLTTLAADRGAELTASAYAQLAADPSSRVREETARLPGLPAAHLVALTADPVTAVRALACRNGWRYLSGPARQRLLADDHDRVRREALLHHHREHPLSRAVLETAQLGDRAIQNCRLEPALAQDLAHHPEADRRRTVARNPHLAQGLLAILARDPDDGVRLEVFKHPDLTDGERDGINLDIDLSYHAPLDWVMDLHHDGESMSRLAASSHALVRRSVARARHLPPDALARLAADEDRGVRLTLAEFCDDAPAELLLEVWQWWTGSLSRPDRPYGHPNFPRTDLLRYADDPNPRMRRLALDDPESTPALVERFSRDQSDEVRARAAADPRLTTASAVRLLDDPAAHIRRAAIGHRAHTAKTLTRLLHDRDETTVETAAQHPRLPVATMREMERMIGRPGI